ncbi:hypothetical protein L226DRAFT_452149 [Lentinus tigrinus ALCF2SS1-7]|uniref:Uncharacterized protein n=1 Tax=Lentinus tigrinus ALCF2SS1-6 TaxID=1328759 RepID=A0A5C2T375_9APHY|nr:hypothetical protein L227DRAFT_596732 [Lentinus tigrinus ALCF2SS1-6]RPD80700.1 hypothetical protein L226DRAFT_452149 [Lentinus tigrinus ALCF2SS1-7]
MSHAIKRKAEELEDSDDEEPMLGRQVLPVANLPDTFDGVPMDGMQYLFTVRRDARSLPHVTRVVNPYELPDVPAPSAEALAVGADSGPSHKAILPSEEWRETFLRRFKNFRKNSTQPTIHVHIPDYSSKVMPDKKERDLWWAFLAGRPESEWNPPKKLKQPKPTRWQQRNMKKGLAVREEAPDDAVLPYDVSDVHSESPRAPTGPPFATPSTTPRDLPLPSPLVPDPRAGELSTSDPKLMDAEDGEILPLVYLPREPTPALMQHIDHRYALHLLMYFGHWIERRLEEGRLPYTEITQSHGRWIFSLLSRVDDWISGDETSLLRGLARGCMGLVAETRRRSIAADGIKAGDAAELIDERSCWMIITAITGLWGQTDLWADAESILCKLEQDGQERAAV